MSVCEETDAVAMVCSDGSLWIITHIAHLMSAPETLRRVEGVPLLTASVSLLAWAGGKLLVPHGGNFDVVGADGSLLASQKESDRGAIVATSGSSMAGEARFAVGWQDSFAAVFTTAGQSGACSLQLTNGGSVCAAGALRGLEWASPVAALAALVVRTYGEEDGVVSVLNVVPVALGGT